MNQSSIIINHEIREVGSFGGSDVRKMLNYYSREDEYREVGGCDRTITASDNELERFKSLNTYEDLVNYGSRQGRYKDRNQEYPLSEGQYSGVCFDQHGLVNPDKLKDELMDSRSHLITSVVSVRREDALRLELATKEDFQRLLRKEWQNQCEQWKVIEPQNIKWAAWFHTDNETNLHVHVVTWDRTGRFSQERPRIPHQQIWSSQSGLRREALKGSITELNREKGFLRDYIVNRVRHECGERINAVRVAELTERSQACKSDIPVDFSEPKINPKTTSKIIDGLVAKMPKDATRAYSYARSSKEVRLASINAISELRKSDELLDRAFKRYEALVKETADAIGFRDALEVSERGFSSAAQEYTRDATYDLNRRAANALLRNCKMGIDFRDLRGNSAIRDAYHVIIKSVREGDFPEDKHGLIKNYAKVYLREAENHANNEKKVLSEIQKERIYQRAESIARNTAYRHHCLEDMREDLRVSRNKTYNWQRKVLQDIRLSQKEKKIVRLERGLQATLRPEFVKTIGAQYQIATRIKENAPIESQKQCRLLAADIMKTPAAKHLIRQETRKHLALLGPKYQSKDRELLKKITADRTKALSESLYKSLPTKQQNHHVGTMGILSTIASSLCSAEQEHGNSAREGMVKLRKHDRSHSKSKTEHNH